MLKKKKYIKPMIEVIRVHICCQMLSESGDTFLNGSTQKDSVVHFVGGDEYGDGDLEGAKINYWEQEKVILKNSIFQTYILTKNQSKNVTN